MIPIKVAGSLARPGSKPGNKLGNIAVPQDGIFGAAGAALRYLQPGALNLTALPPLSLYIHFPWCVRKCPYCDFNSHEVRQEQGFPEDDYLAALNIDIDQPTYERLDNVSRVEPGPPYDKVEGRGGDDAAIRFHTSR